MKAATVEGHRKDKWKHAKLDEITVGERFRQDLGDLEELVNSIREKGIIEPLVVDSNMRLLAGGRRYAAACQLELPTIPVMIREYVDELDSREVELFENIYRKDFRWDERASLVKQIDDLYNLKHEKTGDWSGRKTAELLDRSVGSVSQDLKLARAIEAVPELKVYKTADEALKVLKKFEETTLMAELRGRQQSLMQTGAEADAASAAAGVAGPQLERGLRLTLQAAEKSYIVQDVFKGLQSLPTNGKITIIECDPPYGIDLNAQKASKDSATSTVTSYNEISAEIYPGFLTELCKELFRVAGKDCWLVFWFGPTWQQEVLAALKNGGWAVDEIPAVWTKAQGQTLQPELNFARGYEPFFLARKGKPLMAERGRLNVFHFPGVPGARKYHPTQRPQELIGEILTTLGAGQQTVLVPFLGSGATLLSCFEHGFHGFGFDLSGEYKTPFMLEVEKQTRALFTTETKE